MQHSIHQPFAFSNSKKLKRGNPTPLSDHLLNDFNICFSNYGTQSADISCTITINFPSRLKIFKRSLYCIPFQSVFVIKLPLKTSCTFDNTVVQAVKFKNKKYLLF